MNQQLREKIDLLSERQLSPLEMRNNLILTRNLGMVLHCSHEIDQSTILYLTVNGLPLIESDAFLFLCSENTPPDEDQVSGRGLFHRVFIYEVIEELVTETLTGHYNFYTCQLDGRLVVLVNFSRKLLPNITDEVAAGLRRSCVHIIETAHTRYDLNLSIHCSGVVQRLERLSAEYHSLLNEITFFRYTGTDTTALITGFNPPPCITNQEQTQQNKLYADTCVKKMLDGSSIADYISYIFQELKGCPPYSIPVLLFRIKAIAEMMIGSLRTSNIAIREVGEIQNFIEHIDIAGSLDELERALILSCQHIQTAYLQIKSGDQYLLCRQIEVYIADHISEPNLNLAQISDAMQRSPAFLNTLFREICGDTVFVRIQKLRLQKAAELLPTGETVRTISAMCGFGSVESFYRTFRKYYRMTPKEYQKGMNNPHI